MSPSAALRRAAPSLDRVFHALADPHRLGMVERLSSGPASVSELAAPLGMALPSVLKHLKVLEQSGVAISQKIGRTRTYRLEPRAFAAIERWIAGRRAVWEARFARLDELLAEDDEPTKKSERR